MTVSELENAIGAAISNNMTHTEDGRDMFKSYIDRKLEDTYMKETANITQAMFRAKEEWDKAQQYFSDQLLLAQVRGQATQTFVDKLTDTLEAQKAHYFKTMDELKLRMLSRETMIEEMKTELEKNRSEEIKDGLTFGASKAYTDKGNEIATFGNALASRSKILKPFGKGIAGLGGAIKKANWALALVQFGLSAATANLNYQTNIKELETQQLQADFQLQKASIQAGFQAAQASLSASASRANAITQTYGQLGLQGIKVGANGYVAAYELGTGMIFDIEGSMFKAAGQAIQLAGEHLKYQNAEKYGLKALGAQLGAISQAESAAHGQAQIARERAVFAHKQTSETIALNKNLAKYEHTSRGVQNALGISDEGYTKAWATGERYNLAYTQALKRGAKERAWAQRSWQLRLNQQYAQGAAQLAAEKARIQQQENDAIIDAAMRIKQAWLNLTQEHVKYFHETENAGVEMARTMGFTGDQMNNYVRSLATMQIAVAKLGKNAKDMAKLQTAFQQHTGRNYNLTEDDYKAAFSNMVVMDEGAVTDVTKGMEIFNYSVKDANLLLNESWANVSRMGLNGRKLAKDLAKNMKLAEKFTFKGGVKGLFKMAEWALKIRFNLGSADKMITSFRNGDINDIIKKTAYLRVMGGQMGMRSDPLGMGFDAFNDAQSLGERMEDMASSLGMFNPETGQVEFGQTQDFAIQIAKQFGVPVDDIMNIARHAGKVQQVEGYLGKSVTNFNSDELSTVEENATWNNDNQTWEVNIDNRMKDIRTLTADDVKKLVPKNIEQSKLQNLQQIQNTTITMFSTEQQMENAQYEMRGRLLDALWCETRQMLVKANETAWEKFNEEYSDYEKHLLQNLEGMVKSQGSFLSYFEEGNKTIDKKIAEIEGTIQNLDSAIIGDFGHGWSQIGTALGQSIGAKMGLPVSVIKPPSSDEGSYLWDDADVVYGNDTQNNIDVYKHYKGQSKLSAAMKAEAIAEMYHTGGDRGKDPSQSTYDLIYNSYHNKLDDAFRQHNMERYLEDRKADMGRVDRAARQARGGGSFSQGKSSGGFSNIGYDKSFIQRVGYTAQGSVDSPDGYVGRNQWVASQKIVNNKWLSPVIDYLDKLQRGVTPQPLPYMENLAQEDPDNYNSIYDYLISTNQNFESTIDYKPNVDITIDALNINGRLELVQGSQSVDLITLVKTDKSLQQSIVNYILSALS